MSVHLLTGPIVVKLPDIKQIVAEIQHNNYSSQNIKNRIISELLVKSQN